MTSGGASSGRWPAGASASGRLPARGASASGRLQAQPPPPGPGTSSAGTQEATRLGDYLLEQELSRGGRGSLWRARHTPTDVAVLLRVVPGPSGGPFLAAAGALAKATHPNVAVVVDHGQLPGPLAFAASEAVDGETLASLVARGGPPPPRWTAKVLLTAARALTHLHAQGLCHLALDPTTVVIEKTTERVVLVDLAPGRPSLGLTALDDDAALARALAAAPPEAPAYLAPELVVAGPAPGPAADVHGLGALLFFLLTGAPPFPGPGPAHLLRQVVRQPPDGERARAASPPLVRLCAAALAKDPRARPTVEAFVTALQGSGLLADSGSASAVLGATARLRPGSRAGQRVGPFTLEKELGRGAMGVVYSGRGDDGREVAIKLMSAAVVDERNLKRFSREVAAMGALSHPNVVRLAGASTDAAAPWLAMELIQGKDLQHRLDAAGVPPYEETARIVAQIARGVGHAHGRGVFHRDLKPSNVLVREADGSAVVTDFGLARNLEASRFTRTGDTIGTLAFMSPEQVKGQRAEGTPADVWAIGAILYRCLTGQPPFAAESQLGLAAAIVAGSFPAPRAVRKDIPRDLESVALACLQTDPAARPTAEVVAAALEQRRPLGVPGRGRAPLVAGLAGALLLVAGGVALAARGRGDAPQGRDDAAPVASAPAPPPPSPPWAAHAPSGGEVGWRTTWSLDRDGPGAPVQPALWETAGRVAAPLDLVRAGRRDALAAAYLGQAAPPDGDGRVAVAYRDLALALRYEPNEPASHLLAASPTGGFLGGGAFEARGDQVTARSDNDGGGATLWVGRARWEAPRAALRAWRLAPIDLDELSVRLGAEATAIGALRLNGRSGLAQVAPWDKNPSFPFVLEGEPTSIVFAPQVGDGEALRLGELTRARLEGALRPGPGPIRLALLEAHVGLDRLEVSGRPRRPDVAALALPAAAPLPAACRVLAAFERAPDPAGDEEASVPDLGGPLVALLGPDGAPALELELDHDGARAHLVLRERGRALARVAVDEPPALGWLLLEREGDAVSGALGAGDELLLRLRAATPLPLGGPLRAAYGSSAPRVTFGPVELQAGPADAERDGWDGVALVAPEGADRRAAGEVSDDASPVAAWRAAALRLARASQPALVPLALLGPAGGRSRREQAGRAAGALEAAAPGLPPAVRRDALARAVLARVVAAQADGAERAASALVAAVGQAEATDAVDALERGPDGGPILVERLVKGYANVTDVPVQTAALRAAALLAPAAEARVLLGLAGLARNTRPPPDPGTAAGRAALERALGLIARARKAGGAEAIADQLDGYEGDTLMDLGRMDEALARWDRVVAAKPDGWWGWARRSTCQEQLGRGAAALESTLGALAAASTKPELVERARALARSVGRARPGLVAVTLALVGTPGAERDLALDLARAAVTHDDLDGDLAALALVRLGEPAPARPAGSGRTDGDGVALLVRARAGDVAARAGLAALDRTQTLARHLALLDPELAPLVRGAP